MAEDAKQLSYEIWIRGELDPLWEQHFENLKIEHDAAGNTRLSGPLTDQTALHSVLLKIRDLNLRLISVSEASVAKESAPRTADEEE